MYLYTSRTMSANTRGFAPIVAVTQKHEFFMWSVHGYSLSFCRLHDRAGSACITPLRAPLVEMRYRIRTDHRSYITTVRYTLCPKRPPYLSSSSLSLICSSKTEHTMENSQCHVNNLGRTARLNKKHSQLPASKRRWEMNSSTFRMTAWTIKRFECLSWFAPCLRHFETGKLQICSFNVLRYTLRNAKMFFFKYIQ